MTLEAAETLALKGLAYLVRSAEALERFVAISGLDAASLRARAGEPELLTAVLDFMLTDEQLLMAFCDDESLDARQVHMARHVLGNG
jgi:hypothetical protein